MMLYLVLQKVDLQNPSSGCEYFHFVFASNFDGTPSNAVMAQISKEIGQNCTKTNVITWAQGLLISSWIKKYTPAKMKKKKKRKKIYNFTFYIIAMELFLGISLVCCESDSVDLEYFDRSVKIIVTFDRQQNPLGAGRLRFQLTLQ